MEENILSLLNPRELLKILVDNSQPVDDEEPKCAVRRLLFDALPPRLFKSIKKSLLLIGLAGLGEKMGYLYEEDCTLPPPSLSRVARVIIPHPGSTWNFGKPYITYGLFVADKDNVILRSFCWDANIEDIANAEKTFTSYISSKIKEIEEDIDKYTVAIGRLDKSIEILKFKSKDIIENDYD